MKVTIEVDCTPEEARRAMGLPDVSPLHELYLARLRDAITTTPIGPDMIAAAIKSWAPIGGAMQGAGADLWRQIFTGTAKAPE